MKSNLIKWNIRLILILFCGLINGQSKKIELKGIILDETQNSVPFVAVGIIKKYLGTASTEDGEFSFFITDNELQDSLSVSSLGYDPFKIKVEDFLKLEKKEIVLIESTTELNEIVLLNPLDYVINATKKLKLNTISNPYQMDVLFRRATTEGNVAKFFVENYIKVRDRGPAYGPNVFQVVESRKSADYRIWKRKQWQHDFQTVYNLNPFRPHQSMHKRNLKKFTWKKVGESNYEGEDVVIVEGKLDWVKIKLFIGIDTFKVYRIERGNALFIYKPYDSKRLVLSYFKDEWRLRPDLIPKEYKNTEVAKTHYKTECFVYGVETNKKKINVVSFGEDTDMGLIDLPYNESFWKSLSLPPDTKFYKKIKEGLESNFGVPLERQYELVNK